jgi:hypothetical protein
VERRAAGKVPQAAMGKRRAAGKVRQAAMGKGRTAGEVRQAAVREGQAATKVWQASVGNRRTERECGRQKCATADGSGGRKHKDRFTQHDKLLFR